MDLLIIKQIKSFFLSKANPKYIIGLISFILLLLISFIFISSNTSTILGSKDIKHGDYLVEAENQTYVGSKYRMEVNIDTKDQAINAIGLYMKFDPSKLQIDKLDTTQSFCEFYPENKYNNEKGTISIACGAPNPGYSGQNTIVIIDFQVINMGNSEINILPQSQILLNDGKGTNIYIGPKTHRVMILNSL